MKEYQAHNMSDVKFDLKPVSKKPSRKYRKGSKYDPIIDSFMESEHELVKVEVPEKDANYLRTQLKKRIDARDLQDKVEVSVVNNIAYLEKK
jgi:hypothetical protein